MFSDDKSLVLAYNGEIYNYLEIKSELEAQNVRFRSRCDTEVLLRAYEHWGVEAFNKFNGMWAFTLWDSRTRRLIVCRDRFGVKPMYYTEVDGAWIFASEIKAVAGYPGAFRGMDEAKMMRFITRCFINDNDETIYRGIRSVPPGGYLIVNNGEMTSHRYWKLNVGNRDDGLDADVVNQFRALFDDSVRLRVRSDVPIGTMLSGGLDSTSITCAIDDQRRESGNTSEMLQGFHHTFSACWPGSMEDEESEIDALCARRGLANHKLYPTGSSVADLLPKVVYALEEPFETPIAAVQYMLMEQARARGVTVVLNGHGSDETLGGYPDRFVAPYLAGRLMGGHPLQALMEYRKFRHMGWTNNQVVGEMFDWVAATSKRRILESEQARLGELGILPDPAIFEHLACERSPVDTPTGLSRLNRRLWSAFRQLIMPMWLRMEDRVSMAWSVESRLPFLDYRIVELAFSMPDDLKLRGGYTKYVLREAMKDRLPESITWNPVKRRFAAPYYSWYRGEWRGMIEDLLFGSCKIQAFVDIHKVRANVRAYMNGDDRAFNVQVLWRLLICEICMRTFSEGALESSAHLHRLRSNDAA
jgi:asparagine synthase (glutamine-hydrolysing)